MTINPTVITLIKIFSDENCAVLLKDYCKDGVVSLGNLLSDILGIFTAGIVIAATIGIVWCGFLILSARDSESQVAAAKKRLLNIVIGVVVWVVGASVTGLLLPSFDSSNFEDPGKDIADIEIPEEKEPDDSDKGGGDGKTDGGESESGSVDKSQKFDASYEYYNGNSEIGYWLKVPQNATSGMPLMIFLHGSGETNSPSAVASRPQVTNMMSYADSYGFIALAPVAKTRNWEYKTASLKSIIDTVSEKYKVNKNRIYIWGFSMGARGTFAMINDYPTLSKASVIISNCFAAGNSAANMTKTKIRGILGGAETDYPCMSSNIASIRSAGGSASFETLSGVTHSTMSSSLNYSDIIPWMLNQK